MDYESLARDVHAYMESVGITGAANTKANKKVMLVGHSLGAKTAMAFSCMFPHLVDSLVSLDASPVDRSDCPHLNKSSERMIEEAIALGSLENMPLENAIKKIKTEVKDAVLQTALLFNLNSDGSL
jgi:esterase